MEPDMKERRSRADNALTWWASLNARASTPAPPTRLLAAVLALVAVAAVAGMPLVWHHLTVPAPSFYGLPTIEVLMGLSAASWLLVVAAFALGLAIRTYLAAPSLGVKWTVTVLAVATVNGMFIDYFDWSRRGVSTDVKAFYGPGFFVGLGCAALTVVAAILAWRARE